MLTVSLPIASLAQEDSRVFAARVNGKVAVSLTLSQDLKDVAHRLLSNCNDVVIRFRFDLRADNRLWVDKRIAGSTVQARSLCALDGNGFVLLRSVDNRIVEEATCDTRECAVGFVSSFSRLILFDESRLTESDYSIGAKIDFIVPNDQISGKTSRQLVLRGAAPSS